MYYRWEGGHFKVVKTGGVGLLLNKNFFLRGPDKVLRRTSSHIIYAEDLMAGGSRGSFSERTDDVLSRDRRWRHARPRRWKDGPKRRPQTTVPNDGGKTNGEGARRGPPPGR